MVSEKINELAKGEFVIGRQVLDIITSGMYDNPLMIYREYIQNSVDSLDQAYKVGTLEKSQGEICIAINGFKRSIAIYDNGLGIPNPDVEKTLLSIGFSGKEGTLNRGFRGIGRLGGLAYCKKLRFETRSCQDEKVAIVEWDQEALGALLREGAVVTLHDAITQLSSVSFRSPSPDDPTHFFRATLENVERFHTDALMDISAVKSYISQVAPVPYNENQFRFASEIENYFSNIEGFRTYGITVNNEKVFRPYADEFSTNKERKETISEVEFFSIVDGDRNLIAKGWFGKTSFLSSFSPTITSRGIRVRQGNIEVGNEYFLAGFFSERRFATWQVGEIQVCGTALKTNARRDGFEHTPNYQTFLEKVGLLGQYLSKLCRTASKERCSRQRVDAAINEIKKIIDQDSDFINLKHFQDAKKIAENNLNTIKEFIHKSQKDTSLVSLYDHLKTEIEDMTIPRRFLVDKINGTLLNKKKSKKIIEDLVYSIKANFNDCNTADDLIQLVLSKYLKQHIDKDLNFVEIGMID